MSHVSCLPFPSYTRRLADLIQVQEVTFELADIYLELLEMKQKKFERTAGNLDPTLLKKMVMFLVNRWRYLITNDLYPGTRTMNN